MNGNAPHFPAHNCRQIQGGVKAKPQVQQLAGDKLVDIETHLLELQQLHNELRLLIGLCTDSEDDCPILQEIDHSTTDNPE